MKSLKEKLNTEKIPQHVAIIMDGNGRWAAKHGSARIQGHEHGVDAVRSTVEGAGEIGIKYLTLYAFSTENWGRPRNEVDALLALSYSSKWEISDAARKIAIDTKNGKLNPEDIDDKLFEKYLSTSHLPNPEILIRTSGEYRISNFLLWQIAYAELYFLPKLWPDFRKEDLFEAVYDFQNRERKI
jgi:undecaprenyl diphosphate synthase